jgi:diguanylate cyclase (GGDEF)-like protein
VKPRSDELYETCRTLIDAGNAADALREITAAPRELSADVLRRLYQTEKLYHSTGKALQELQRGNFDRVPEDGADSLSTLSANLKELSRYTAELVKGNLATDCPPRQNHIAVGVKNLHSKLNHLVWQLDQVAHGDYDQAFDDMGDLSEGFNWMTSQLRAKKAQAAYELEHDVPTGLLNRSAFMRRAYGVIRQQPDKCGVMMCCGLDNIKYINETYGHEAGDTYIAAAADSLRHYEDRGLVARIAGDEFAIYIHGYKDEADICGLDEEIVDRLSSTMVDIGDVVKVRASCGVVLYPQDALTVDNMLKYASHTMFDVKSRNRGSLMRFTADTYQKKANLFSRQEMLNCLIDEKQIRFAFQPIFRLDDCSIYGYEALMRPNIEGFSEPLDILALAEAQSKLKALEKITFEVLFEWLQQNLTQLGNAKVFFNTISTEYLKQAELEAIHRKYKELCEHIVFEILETSAGGKNFIQDIYAFRNQMDVKVAIDDYGCGYSNDLRLISLEPDIVKIDHFFIKDIDKDSDKQQLLKKIVEYCKLKDIDTLAEGIETGAELDAVIRLGFTYAQGYYLGKPEFHLASSPYTSWSA